MSSPSEIDAESFEIARRWCQSKGSGWAVRHQAGRGGTAPVFEIGTPEGARALKIYDAAFSSGSEGTIQEKRVEQQIALGDHTCPYLIKVYDGGRFEDRLFLLMNRAPGSELVKRLRDVPRNKIRQIVGQIAQACIFLRQYDLCHRDIKSENVFISDDFELATLLDVSVTRNIYDPVGLGTDHDGQLPIVATARYCPPEYLFRLLDPEPNLWHALDIYQLGGLLHDLIMREPLFQTEYLRSKENRYRFAWAVATISPIVRASDVDQDLVLAARRALDKDWKRRSLLKLEDFLSDADGQRARALDAIGLSYRADIEMSEPHRANILRRVSEVASELDVTTTEHLRQRGATTQHFLEPGDDDCSKRLRFVWNAGATDADAVFGEVELQITLALRDGPAGLVFENSATLRAIVSGDAHTATMNLPDVEDNADSSEILREQLESALGNLAADVAGNQARD